VDIERILELNGMDGVGIRCFESPVWRMGVENPGLLFVGRLNPMPLLLSRRICTAVPDIVFIGCQCSDLTTSISRMVGLKHERFVCS
jgi:hypothetical protein